MDGITYPYPNFKAVWLNLVEIRTGMSNYIQFFYDAMITYPCLNIRAGQLISVSKEGPGSPFTNMD